MRIRYSTPIAFVALLGGFLLQGFASDAKAAQERAIIPVNAAAACTKDESWAISRGVPESLRQQFSSPPKEDEVALKVFVDALLLRLATKDSEVRIFSEYWMWRTLYHLKLFHLAHVRFNQMLAQPATPENAIFRVAALQCLNQIRRQFPSLTLLPGAVEALAAHPIDELLVPAVGPNTSLVALRHSVWEAVAAFSLSEISRAPTDKLPDLSVEYKLLQASGPYDALVRSQAAAYVSNDAASLADSVRFGVYFLRSPLPEQLKRYVDIVHLNLARIYYAKGDFDRAIKEYKKIQNTSNYFTSTMIELAWSHVMRRQYSEAVGTTYNLLTGGLKSAFAPDAPVALSIAYFETCNYPLAYQGLRFFRKVYEKSYNWLKEWGGKTRGGPIDLYQSVIGYIKEKEKGKSELPAQIGTELLRSPVLIANQQEINLIFDEKNAIRRHIKLLGKMNEVFRTRAMQQGATALHNTMLKFSGESPTIEGNLVAQINADLHQRVVSMVKQLNSSVENIQLVEIEIYNSAGDDIILENARPEYKLAAKEAREKALKTKRKGEGAVLDWGRFPAKASDAGKTEIWEDELGALKTNIADLCPKK